MNQQTWRVLLAIEQFIEQNGYPPSYAEIADLADMPISTAGEHVRRLASAGIITRRPRSPRSIKIVGKQYPESEVKECNKTP